MILLWTFLFTLSCMLSYGYIIVFFTSLTEFDVTGQYTNCNNSKVTVLVIGGLLLTWWIYLFSTYPM